MSDLSAKCFVRKGNSLVPADFAGDEFLREIGEGREVMISIRKARSPAHHRFFFAMLRKVCENSEQWSNEEVLLDDLKMAVGHRETHVNALTGDTVVRAKSINFASMEEFTFRRFVKRCCFVLAKAIGVDPQELMDETDQTQRKAA